MSVAELHDLAAPYALDALEPDEVDAFERHLERCASCRLAVDNFQETAAALAAAVAPATPPAELRARVLADVQRPRVITLRRAAATIAALAAGAALAFGLSRALGREPGTRTVALTGARGSLVVDGSSRARLVLYGLRAPPRGHTYEAWVVARGRNALPAGLFRAGEAKTVVVLTRRVPEGARVAVTVEPAGGSVRLTQAPLFSTVNPL